MLRDNQLLEQSLIDVEISNARAIALGRRFVALQQEAAHLRGEIASVKVRYQELAEIERTNPQYKTASVENFRSTKEYRVNQLLRVATHWIKERVTGKSNQVQACLDVVSGIHFKTGMALHLVDGKDVILTGWAFLRNPQLIATSTMLKAAVDGVKTSYPVKQIFREDVADTFNRPDIESCGFVCKIPSSNLLGKTIDLKVEIVDGKGQFHSKPLGKLTFIS